MKEKIEHKGKHVTQPYKNLSNGSKSMVNQGIPHFYQDNDALTSLLHIKSKLSDIKFSNETNDKQAS